MKKDKMKKYFSVCIAGFAASAMLLGGCGPFDDVAGQTVNPGTHVQTETQAETETETEAETEAKRQADVYIVPNETSQASGNNSSQTAGNNQSGSQNSSQSNGQNNNNSNSGSSTDSTAGKTKDPEIRVVDVTEQAHDPIPAEERPSSAASGSASIADKDADAQSAGSEQSSGSHAASGGEAAPITPSETEAAVIPAETEGSGGGSGSAAPLTPETLSPEEDKTSEADDQQAGEKGGDQGADSISPEDDADPDAADQSAQDDSKDSKETETDAGTEAQTETETESETEAAEEAGLTLTMTAGDASMSLLIGADGAYAVYGLPGGEIGELTKLLEDSEITHLDTLLVTAYEDGQDESLEKLLDAVTIDTVILPGETDEKAAEALTEPAEAAGAKVLTAKTGDSIEIGQAVLQILAASESHDGNTDAVIASLSYGSGKALILQDIDGDALTDMMKALADFDADMLIMGGTGSTLEGHEDLITAIKPEYAMIWSGAKADPENQTSEDKTLSDENLPDQATMDILAAAGVHVLRSDLQGSLSLTCDGKTLAPVQKPCDDYTGRVDASEETEVPQAEQDGAAVLDETEETETAASGSEE